MIMTTSQVKRVLNGKTAIVFAALLALVQNRSVWENLAGHSSLVSLQLHTDSH